MEQYLVFDTCTSNPNSGWTSYLALPVSAMLHQRLLQQQASATRAMEEEHPSLKEVQYTLPELLCFRCDEDLMDSDKLPALVDEAALGRISTEKRALDGGHVRFRRPIYAGQLARMGFGGLLHNADLDLWTLDITADELLLLRGDHVFEVRIGGCTYEQAQRVLQERLGHDEDYGFNYTLNW